MFLTWEKKSGKPAKQENNLQKFVGTESWNGLQWSSVPHIPGHGIFFPVTKHTHLSGTSQSEVENLWLWMLFSRSSPEFLLSSHFLICTYRVPLGSFSWSPLPSTCFLASKLPCPQDGHFDLMNQWQHLWSAARFSGRKFPGLPSGCERALWSSAGYFFCSLFLLINAYVLSRVACSQSNWAIDVFCCMLS